MIPKKLWIYWGPSQWQFTYLKLVLFISLIVLGWVFFLIPALRLQYFPALSFLFLSRYALVALVFYDLIVGSCPLCLSVTMWLQLINQKLLHFICSDADLAYFFQTKTFFALQIYTPIWMFNPKQAIVAPLGNWSQPVTRHNNIPCMQILLKDPFPIENWLFYPKI